MTGYNDYNTIIIVQKGFADDDNDKKGFKAATTMWVG